jgi:hypothetical protein
MLELGAVELPKKPLDGGAGALPPKRPVPAGAGELPNKPTDGADVPLKRPVPGVRAGDGVLPKEKLPTGEGAGAEALKLNADGLLVNDGAGGAEEF